MTGTDNGADYDRPRRVSALAWVVLARNPGPMTLEGTNTWVLRAGAERPAVVVDPGPADEAHLRAVAATGPIAQILLTHRHHDHSDGARRLHELTGAGVRALDPARRIGAEGLGEGDVVAVDELELRVWATPGHTSDLAGRPSGRDPVLVGVAPADRAARATGGLIKIRTRRSRRDGSQSLCEIYACFDRFVIIVERHNNIDQWFSLGHLNSSLQVSTLHGCTLLLGFK